MCSFITFHFLYVKFPLKDEQTRNERTKGQIRKRSKEQKLAQHSCRQINPDFFLRSVEADARVAEVAQKYFGYTPVEGRNELVVSDGFDAIKSAADGAGEDPAVG